MHQYSSQSQAFLGISSGLSSLVIPLVPAFANLLLDFPQVTHCLIELLSNALSKSNATPISPECRQVLKKSKFPALPGSFVPRVILVPAPSSSPSTLPPNEPGA